MREEKAKKLGKDEREKVIDWKDPRGCKWRIYERKDEWILEEDLTGSAEALAEYEYELDLQKTRKYEAEEEASVELSFFSQFEPILCTVIYEQRKKKPKMWQSKHWPKSLPLVFQRKGLSRPRSYHSFWSINICLKML